MRWTSRGAAQGTVSTVCIVPDFSHQMLFIDSKGKYLLSFKNIFDNVNIEEKLYPVG